MDRLDPPGFLDDFNEAEKERWSQKVSEWLDAAGQGNPANNDGPRSQFFNPLTNPPSADTQIAVISWNAFPRQVKANSISDTQRWRSADADRNVQDEYCEWSVTRDPVTGKIIRVDFTCEGPEYWEALGAFDKSKVLELYRTFVSPSVAMADLFDGDIYNPRNGFNNTTYNGVMHLIQRANSLTAEIELGAAATIRRVQNGSEITDAQELIRCSRYGEPGRNSDPFIGAQVNALARQRADITVNNPVGLYFHDFNPVGWVTPDGEDPRAFWKYLRGKNHYFVRAGFEVPANRGYVVGDILIADRNIKFGAQISDFITIKLEGLATRIGKSAVAPLSGCKGAAAPRPAAPDAWVHGAPPLRTRGGPQVSGAVPAVPPAVAGGLSPAEQAIVAQLPTALRRSLEGGAAEPDAAPPALLPYPKLPDSKFSSLMVNGEIIAYASPDSTYAVTKRLIDRARSSIVIGIYDFNADYMKDALKRAMRRSVSVSLMLDTNKDDAPNLFDELRQLGANCVNAPSSSAGNPIAYFGNAHEKIIVIDGEIVLIQSGNWSENSIPLNEGDGTVTGDFVPGNRDMGLAIKSRDLAEFFAELVARDMRLSKGEPPSAPPAPPASLGDLVFFEAAPPSIPPLFASRTFTPSTPVRITPVVTPENFKKTVGEFVRSAKRSIRLEQQYIRGGQETVEAVLTEISAARRQNPELMIRIIVSPKYLYGAIKQKFLDAMERFDFAFDDNFRYLSARHFVHCHNKLIVVDEERVLLGSQNWSTTGIASNREASLLVEHAGIAGYFAEIFNSDWQLSEPTGAPDELTPASPVRTAREFADGGVVMSSVRDYWDV